MSILNDKTFENMDWLSQAVEPYHCRINDILALMPDEHTLSTGEVLSWLSSGSYGSLINKSSIVGALYSTIDELSSKNMTYEERDMLCKHFTLKTIGEVTVNAFEGTMTGEIKLIKLGNIVSDKDVKAMMQRHTTIGIRGADCNTQALVDVCNILFEGLEELTAFNKAETKKHKLFVLSTYLKSSVEKDIFKIRSYEAYKTFSTILGSYLSTKNPTHLAEIYRVVMMAKRGQVVYTVKGGI